MQVPGQPELHDETLSQNKITEKERKKDQRMPTTDVNEIQNITGNFENSGSEKLENSEVDKFVATNDLPKLNQVNLSSLKRSTASVRLKQ